MTPRFKSAFDRANELVGARGFKPIFWAVKGSELYDMPGTHTDLDLRGIYLAPTVDALSIRKAQHTVEITEGKLDVVAWEAERFFHHLLKHNGNMVEMLLAPDEYTRRYLQARDLKAIGERYLTKKLFHYYRGFARNQLKRSNTQMRTGKGVVYTYREMYAGIVLMQTGRIIFPWTELKSYVDENIFVSKILDRFTMDRQKAPQGLLDKVEKEFQELDKILDYSFAHSELPEDYDGYEKLNTLLLRWRYKGWTKDEEVA